MFSTDVEITVTDTTVVSSNQQRRLCFKAVVCLDAKFRVENFVEILILVAGKI